MHVSGQITWGSPLATVLGPGAGQATARVKGKKSADVVKDSGLETVGDLIGHLPRSYVAKGTLSNLDELREGDLLTIVGEVAGAQLKTYRDRRTGREAARIEMRVRAENGALDLTFFDRAKHISEWRIKEFSQGTLGIFRGKLKWWQGHWQLTNPEYRLFAEGGGAASVEAMPELVPLYPEVRKVSSWVLEEAIGLALDLVTEVPDVLPEALRAEHDLLDAGTAYRWIHRPDSHSQLGAARKRLKFDEAFVTQAVLARRRLLTERSDATPRSGRPDGVLAAFDDTLPFSLTAGQATVGEEIGHELAGSHPMHRLLQGEVGSGKTLVALRAMLQVVDSGGQAVLLAPTEVLAQQHLRSITTMLDELARGGELGAPEHATRVRLLTGSMNTAQRRQALADAASGDAGIVIGTHALLEEHVQFYDLGLVVIDEQHRFGVEQRAALSGKGARPPHVLVMTATPIPRTVAMTVFGDLDTSTLTELPAGRGEVQTNVVPTLARPAWLDRAWERIREEVGKGRQAYVVCPRIGDEPPPEEGPELHSVEELAPDLASGALQGLRVERLHGRMSPDDKDRVMQSFAAGEVDVLVSTTVIEVGVDVPNATVMVIMDADRFGVSQLHQLRGRIGRGGHAGLCLLVSNTEPDSPSMERLDAVASTRDGFALSRIDLEQRREGNVLGVEQSGRRRTLKLLSVLTDEDVIATAREAAMRLLREDPDLDTAPGLARAVKELEDTAAADYLEMT